MSLDSGDRIPEAMVGNISEYSMIFIFFHGYDIHVFMFFMDMNVFFSMDIIVFPWIFMFFYGYSCVFNEHSLLLMDVNITDRISE